MRSFLPKSWRIWLVATSLAVVCMAPGYAEAQLFRITGMSNFSFGTWSGSNDMVASDTVCIYRSSGTGYRITASGNGAGNSFLSTGSSTTVAYEVHWKHGGGSFVSLTANNSQTFTGASNSLTCSGVDNAELQVTFPESNLSAARADSYTGTLSILLEPN